MSITSIEEQERVGVFAEYTPFYETFLECWDYSLSIEDNYIMIQSELKTTVILFDFDEEEDLYL